MWHVDSTVPTEGSSDVKERDELEACCLEVSGVAGVWRECDFNQNNNNNNKLNNSAA